MAGPVVIANPADDAAFVETVRRLSRGERNDRAFERRLRARYPAARVRRGVLSGDESERWYVYRDGLWAGDSTRRVGGA